MALMPILVKMEQAGIRIDAELLHGLSADMEKKLAALES